MATRLFRKREDILEALISSLPSTTLRLIALYSSQYDAVIEDPRFMSIPITDHLIEGWGVFDTLNIYNSVPYQLQSHIDRLFNSASASKMPITFSKESMISKLNSVISSYPNTRIRFFISGSNYFYILAYSDVSQNKPTEISEVSVTIPPKPVFFASIKTTNYLTNALEVIEARSKGGYMGISLDDDGNLAESAIANIAVVNNNRFLTPLPKFVLEGTTVKRVLTFCEELAKSGELEYAGRENISLEMAYNSQEIMMIGGDSVISIVKLDDVVISQGIGPITAKIFEFLAKDKSGSGISDV